jgi:ATP synthase protein I
MLRNHLLAGYKLIILQLILLSIVIGIFGFANNWLGAFSSLLGGVAWIIPSLYFVRKLFNSKKNKDSQALAKAFIIGEGVKLLLSIGLAALTIIFLNVSTGAFLSGYTAAIAASFLMPFLYRPIKTAPIKNDT